MVVTEGSVKPGSKTLKPPKTSQNSNTGGFLVYTGRFQVSTGTFAVYTGRLLKGCLYSGKLTHYKEIKQAGMALFLSINNSTGRAPFQIFPA